MEYARLTCTWGDAYVTNPTPAVDNNTEVSISDSVTTRIAGNITLLNDLLPVGDVNVKIRGTELEALRQTDGTFSLELAASDSERSIVLDISGDAIVGSSVETLVPAQAELAIIDAAVSARTPPITFNLETGGVLQNEASPTRTSVSVPANAFQFDDGTLATGDAQISITEIDIEDLGGAGAWAPNLIGIAAGSNEPSAIWTYGMSDFHFSQDGRELQLRQGVEATIGMDLLTPYVFQDGDTVPVNASAGQVMPLWHFDREDIIWKEEGAAIIVADAQSESGFRAAGEVTHFSSWNIDVVAPFLMATVNVVLVDENGALITDKVVKSYKTISRIPPEEGAGFHGETSWSTTKNMTPQNNQIEVLGNNSSRQERIDNTEHITGWTVIDIIVDNVIVPGIGVVNNGPLLQRKIFVKDRGDHTVTFKIILEGGGFIPPEPIPPSPIPPPPPPPPPQPVNTIANINVVLVDFQGEPQNHIDVISYRAIARASGGPGAYQPANSIDGNNEPGRDSLGNYFHTGGGPNQSLAVSFPDPVSLSQITIVGRADCCSSRDVYNVTLFDQNDAVLGQYTALNANNAGHQVTQELTDSDVQAVSKIVITSNSSTGTDTLQVAEVIASSAVDGSDLALASRGATVVASSVYSSSVAWQRQNQRNLTPESNQMTVVGNTQQLIDSGRVVTTEISIDNIVIEAPYKIMGNPDVQTRAFNNFGGDNNITFEVVVFPQ